jgi:hypothetical protein
LNPVNFSEHKQVKKFLVKVVTQVPLFRHGFVEHGRVIKFVVIKLDAFTQAAL